MHRAAWPSRHHFSVSSGEQEVLNALVENTGSIPLYVFVAFGMVSPAHTVVEIVSNQVILSPGAEEVFSAVFVPPLLGTYSNVITDIFFGTTPDPNVAFQGAKVFSFDVVA